MAKWARGEMENSSPNTVSVMLSAPYRCSVCTARQDRVKQSFYLTCNLYTSIAPPISGSGSGSSPNTVSVMLSAPYRCSVYREAGRGLPVPLILPNM
jgi:hypothetical protein